MVCKATAVKNGAQAASYFETDNYYAKDGDQSPSRWSGKLAENLGLSGAINKSDFLKALNGTMPTGEIMRGGGASGQHRPATDVTFSAPKTVSLLAFAAGDERVIEAHQEAVAAAMSYAEQHLIVARLTENGAVREVKPGNMLAARFLHDTSRNLDPQLHDHFLVLNATRTEDGKLRAIDNHKLFQGQMMLGAIYHAELQRNLENLGYQTEGTLEAKNGEFEVSGIDSEYIESKSSRRAAIIKALEKRGIDPSIATARQLDTAALDTRKAKGEIDHVKLHADWQDEFAEAMPGFERPAALTAEQISARDAERTEKVTAALDWATEHHFERSNAVKREDLIKTAFAESKGATVEQIEAEFDRRTVTKELLTDGKRFTTREALEREQTLIQTMREGQGGVKGIYSPDEAAQALENQSLNAGQKQAAGMMMCAEDRFAMVQGVAGSGKTHMLKEVRPLLEAQGYKLIGVAPSHQAAKELRDVMGEGVTVQSFNQSPSLHEKLNEKSIIVMDEAGLCDAKTMEQFAAIVKQTGARAIVIGDQRQFKAVGAGNPFLLYQEQGIRMAEMNETRRQAPNPYLLETINLASDGKMKEALERLPVTVIKSDAERHATLADDYVATRASLSEKVAAGEKGAERGVILLTGSNADRRALNDAIRESLELKGKGEEITVLDRADMTSAEQKLLRSYQPGQVLKFSQGYKRLGVAAGGMLTVDRIEKTGVICKHPNGQEVKFQPNRLNPENWQVLRAEMLEFSVGDEVRFRQNQRDENAPKGSKAYTYNTNDKGVVTAIDREAGTMAIRNDGKQGQEITLSLNDPQFITHAYAMTGHSAQGATVHSAICDFRGGSLTTSRESFYTDISRATTDVRVYTDEAKLLAKNAGRAIERPNAIDVVGKDFFNQEGAVKMEYEIQSQPFCADYSETTARNQALRDEANRLASNLYGDEDYIRHGFNGTDEFRVSLRTVEINEQGQRVFHDTELSRHTHEDTSESELADALTSMKNQNSKDGILFVHDRNGAPWAIEHLEIVANSIYCDPYIEPNEGFVFPEKVEFVGDGPAMEDRASDFDMSDEQRKRQQRGSNDLQWGADGDSYVSREGNLFVRDANGDFVSDASINIGHGKQGQVRSIDQQASQHPNGEPDHRAAAHEEQRMMGELQQAQQDARQGGPDYELMAEQSKAIENGQSDLESNRSYDPGNGWRQPEHANGKNAEPDYGR